MIIVVYDYYAEPSLISKQQAIDIAISGIQCTKDPYRLNSTTIIGQLFHIKNNNVFFVDDKNMQDMNLANNYLSTVIKSKDYVWEIGWDCYDATLFNEPSNIVDSEHHLKFVDAKSGVLLK